MFGYVVLNCGRNQRTGGGGSPTLDERPPLCQMHIHIIEPELQRLQANVILHRYTGPKSDESMDGWFLLSARCNTHAAYHLLW